MNIFEALLISLRRASEVSVSIMKPRDDGVINHGLMILLFMIHHKGEIKISEISEHLGVTSGAATGIADKLEKLNLVERTRSEEDRRIVTLRISEKGNELIQSKKKEHVQLYQYILQDFSEEELLNTIKMLNRISDRIEGFASEKKSMDDKGEPHVEN